MHRSSGVRVPGWDIAEVRGEESTSEDEADYVQANASLGACRLVRRGALGLGLTGVGVTAGSSEQSEVQAAAPTDIGWIAPAAVPGDIGWNSQGGVGA
ncbi:hypothetical protein SCALM49S_07397 [Streptomyces californicus]